MGFEELLANSMAHHAAMSEILTVLRFKQLENALSPTDARLLGRVTVVRPLQPLNVCAPMEVTPSGMVRFVIAVLP